MTQESVVEYVSCDLCGCDLPLVIYPSTRNWDDSVCLDVFRSSGDEKLKDRLVRCKKCGFVYVSPRLKYDLVMRGYANAADEVFVSQSKGREKTFRKSLNIIEAHRKNQRGRIFDVGTANGSFLKVAKDSGWEVAGCEPSRWMNSCCKEHYGIEVSPGTIFDAGHPNESFDLVTLWDVLEHTSEPMKVIRECKRILRSCGLLVLTYPDIGSLVARLMGRKWVFLLSVHYYYFTRRTIAAALEKCGFAIVHMRAHIQYLDLGYVLFRATPFIGNAGRALQSFAVRANITQKQIPYWMGQTLVIAKRN